MIVYTGSQYQLLIAGNDRSCLFSLTGLAAETCAWRRRRSRHLSSRPCLLNRADSFQHNVARATQNHVVCIQHLEPRSAYIAQLGPKTAVLPLWEKKKTLGIRSKTWAQLGFCIVSSAVLRGLRTTAPRFQGEMLGISTGQRLAKLGDTW